MGISDRIALQDRLRIFYILIVFRAFCNFGNAKFRIFRETGIRGIAGCKVIVFSITAGKDLLKNSNIF